MALTVFNILTMLMEKKVLFYLSGVLSFYVLVSLVLISFFFHPLICLGNRPRKVFKKAFLIFVDNMLVSSALSLVLGLSFLISRLLLPLLLLVYGAFAIYFISYSFAIIWEKYHD
jgi:hypothetical protein